MKRRLIVLALGGATAALLGACGGGGGVAGISTGDVQSFVNSHFPSSVTSMAGAPADETVAVTSDGCVQSGTGKWDCLLRYSVKAPAEGIDQDYSVTLNVTCDATGTCEYPASTGTPVKP